MRMILVSGGVVVASYNNALPSQWPGLVADPTDTVDVGWILNPDGTFSPPGIAPAVPTSISPRQARLQLLADSNLTAINSLIAASPQSYQIAWEFASVILRSDAVVQALQANSPYNTPALMDAFFLSASKL